MTQLMQTIDGALNEMSRVSIDFAGEVVVMMPGETVSFGREAEIEIDTNPALHRMLGRFYWRSDSWWVENIGSKLLIVLQDLNSVSSVLLTPGRRASLTFENTAVRFSAGRTDYELLVTLDEPPVTLVRTSFAPAGNATTTPEHVPLVGDQRLLALALAEYKLLNPHSPTRLPANKQIAFRFGWSLKSFDRKLDKICRKFSKVGVLGLSGEEGAPASARRQSLVEHLVASGALTVRDLDELEDWPKK